MAGGATSRPRDRAAHGALVSSRLEAAAQAATDEAAGDEDELVDVMALKLATGGRSSLGGLRKLQIDVLGEDEDWNYYILTDIESRQRLLDVLGEYAQLPSDSADWAYPKAWADLIDNINDIELYGPVDRADASLEALDFEGHNEVECLLWPAQYKSTAGQRITRVREALDAVGDGAQVLDVDPRPDWLVVRVSVDADGLDALLNTNVVQKVLAPPGASINPETVAAAAPPTHLPNPINSKVGVVDGIVSASNPFVGNYVISSKDFPTGHAYPVPDEHGTRVAGVAIWGDLDVFVHGQPTPAAVPIVSARVLELDLKNNTMTKVAGASHIATIDEAVRWLASEGARIISMSINYPGPASSPTRTPLTYLVDQLARELNLVIVVSTGNYDPALDGHHVLNDYPDYLTTPDAAIASPGDAAIAVTVGSFAKRDTLASSSPTARVVAKANQPSHFTRIDPQRRGGVARRKPEFLHHGGNGVWESATSSLLVNEPGTSVVVPNFGTSGSDLVHDNGTSFSAPAVAHEFALISDRYPDAGANLLRAMAALSARMEVRSPDPASLPVGRLCAYGVPRAERILESDAARVILTFEGEIPTNTTLVHRVPIPPEYAEGFNMQEFNVALAFDPPVRRTRREYTTGRMQCELVRGLSEADVIDIYSRQPTQPEIDADPSLAKRALPEGELRPSLDPSSQALSANTLIVRSYPRGGDWDRQHGDYFLVVTHRHNPSTEAQRRDYPTQTYAAAVELRLHDRPDLNLYNLVRNQLRARPRARN